MAISGRQTVPLLALCRSLFTPRRAASKYRVPYSLSLRTSSTSFLQFDVAAFSFCKFQRFSLRRGVQPLLSCSSALVSKLAERRVRREERRGGASDPLRPDVTVIGIEPSHEAGLGDTGFGGGEGEKFTRESPECEPFPRSLLWTMLPVRRFARWLVRSFVRSFAPPFDDHPEFVL